MNGISVIPDEIKDVSFERDETDRKFYEVALFCNAILVTGNLAHYPENKNIILPRESLLSVTCIPFSNGSRVRTSARYSETLKVVGIHNIL